MAQTVQVNFRVDKELKQQAEMILDDIGLSMSTAYTIFLKKITREGGIPFELKTDPFYSESNMRHLQQGIRQLENGQVVIKTMEELEELADE